MLWWPLVIVLLLLVLLLFDVPKKIAAYRELCLALKKIPGWPTHWFWGNIHQMENTDEQFHAWQEKAIKNRWKLSRVWYGPFWGGVEIHHPDMIKHILKAPKAGFAYQYVEPWLGKGLLIANGAKWFRNRRLLTPAFHFEILKPYVQVYNDCTAILLQKLRESATKNEPVEMYHTISQLTLDVVLRCAFSFNSNCQREGEASKYIKCVLDVCDSVSERFLIPLYQIDFVYNYLTLSGWRHRRALKTVHSHSEAVIKERRVSLGLTDANEEVDMQELIKKAKAGRKHLDFLDVLLTARDEKGVGMNDLEIRNEVDTFMFEGYDTTANALSWTLYLLAKHPEHQERCREEVRSVLQGKEQLEYEDLSKLKYVHWCIKEGLRHYPPVYSIWRDLPEDTVLDGYTIPKDSWVNVNIVSIHHQPDIWENPDEFDPIRFQPDNTTNRHPYAFMPFSAGPRNCIGQNFAQNEEKVVIASILNNFKLSLVKGHKVEVMESVLLTTKKDIKISLTPL